MTDFLLLRLSPSSEPHDKTNKMSVCPAKTQYSLGIRPVWSESLACAQWVAKDPRFLYVDSEDSVQTERMPRLIWVFAGRTVILSVLSCRASDVLECLQIMLVVFADVSLNGAVSFRLIWCFIKSQFPRSLASFGNVSFHSVKNDNRKVQGVPQSQTAANPWHQEEEKMDRN